MRESSFSIFLQAIAPLAFLTVSCTHALQVKNLEAYAVPLKLGGGPVEKPDVAFTPFNGRPDELWYFNTLVERLAQDPALGEVRTDYIPRLGERAGIQPDLILEVRPLVDYRSSGWNFVINWPGFLIFTPAWNGYVYHADIMTEVVIKDQDGSVLDQLQIPVSYSIRHADMDRTIWTGLTWLEVSALALIGGIYNAFVFDRDTIVPLETQIKDNYSNFVIVQVQQRVRSIAEAIQTPNVRQPGQSPLLPPPPAEATPPTEEVR